MPETPVFAAAQTGLFRPTGYNSFGVYGQANDVLPGFDDGRFVSPGAPRGGMGWDKVDHAGVNSFAFGVG